MAYGYGANYGAARLQFGAVTCDLDLGNQENACGTLMTINKTNAIAPNSTRGRRG